MVTHEHDIADYCQAHHRVARRADHPRRGRGRPRDAGQDLEAAAGRPPAWENAMKWKNLIKVALQVDRQEQDAHPADHAGHHHRRRRRDRHGGHRQGGARRASRTRSPALGTNMIVIIPGSMQSARGAAWGPTAAVRLTLDDAEQAEARDATLLEAVSPVVAPAPRSSAAAATGTRASGRCRRDYLEIRDWQLSSGRVLRPPTTSARQTRSASSARPWSRTSSPTRTRSASSSACATSRSRSSAS